MGPAAATPALRSCRRCGHVQTVTPAVACRKTRLVFFIFSAKSRFAVCVRFPLGSVRSAGAAPPVRAGTAAARRLGPGFAGTVRPFIAPGSLPVLFHDPVGAIQQHGVAGFLSYCVLCAHAPGLCGERLHCAA